MKTAKTKNGFTIVELLIVIVVIGILAALVLSSFAQAQTKARNAQTITVVKDYQKALIAYATERGAYPATGACLGERTSPPPCHDNAIDATFNNAIRPYMGGRNPLALPSTKPLSYMGSTRYGAAFAYVPNMSLDGNSRPWGIHYMIEGANPCGLDVGTPAVGVNWPIFSSDSDPGRKGFSERHSNNTFCSLLLPNPDAL